MQLASAFSRSPLSAFIHSCPLPPYPSYSSPSPAPLPPCPSPSPAPLPPYPSYSSASPAPLPPYPPYSSPSPAPLPPYPSYSSPSPAPLPPYPPYSSPSSARLPPYPPNPSPSLLPLSLPCISRHSILLSMPTMLPHAPTLFCKGIIGSARIIWRFHLQSFLQLHLMTVVSGCSRPDVSCQPHRIG